MGQGNVAKADPTPEQSTAIVTTSTIPATSLDRLAERSLRWAPSESDKADSYRNLRYIEVCCDEFSLDETIDNCEAARAMYALRVRNMKEWRIGSSALLLVLATIAVIVGVRWLADELGAMVIGLIGVAAVLSPILIKELREAIFFEESRRLNAWDAAVNKLLKRRRALELGTGEAA